MMTDNVLQDEMEGDGLLMQSQMQDTGVDPQAEIESETEFETELRVPSPLPSADPDAEVVVGGEEPVLDSVPAGPQDAVQMQDPADVPAADDAADSRDGFQQLEDSLREELLTDLQQTLELTPEEQAAEDAFRELQLEVLTLQKEALELEKEQAPEQEAADAEYRESILSALDTVTQNQETLIDAVTVNTRNQKDLYRAQMAGNAMLLIILAAVLFLAGARIAGAFWGNLNRD